MLCPLLLSIPASQDIVTVCKNLSSRFIAAFRTTCPHFFCRSTSPSVSKERADSRHPACCSWHCSWRILFRTLFSCVFTSASSCPTTFPEKIQSFFRSLPQNTLELMPTAFPLTMNRTAIALLQGIEATSIPVCLKLSGCTSSESLRIYGVLTGMALPCILFPSALTNSLSVMLMPAVAQEQCSGSVSSLNRLILRAIGGCFTLGLISCFFFLITGNFIGNTLFTVCLRPDLF